MSEVVQKMKLSKPKPSDIDFLWAFLERCWGAVEADPKPFKSLRVPETNSPRVERVLLGLEMLLDPENELVDQDSEALEKHPSVLKGAWLGSLPMNRLLIFVCEKLNLRPWEEID